MRTRLLMNENALRRVLWCDFEDEDSDILDRIYAATSEFYRLTFRPARSVSLSARDYATLVRDLAWRCRFVDAKNPYDASAPECRGVRVCVPSGMCDVVPDVYVPWDSVTVTGGQP